MRPYGPVFALLLVLGAAAVMGSVVGFLPPLPPDALVLPAVGAESGRLLAADVFGRTRWSLTMVLLIVSLAGVSGPIADELRRASALGDRGRRFLRVCLGGVVGLVVAMIALAVAGVSYAGEPGARLLRELRLHGAISVDVWQDGVIVLVSACVYLLAFAFCVPALTAGGGAAAGGAPAGGEERLQRLLVRGALLLSATAAEFAALFRWAVTAVDPASSGAYVAQAFVRSHALANGAVLSLLLAVTWLAARRALAQAAPADDGRRPGQRIGWWPLALLFLPMVAAFLVYRLPP